MSEIKLLPCPFCGGEANVYEQKHREYQSTYFVSCKGCHCKSMERIEKDIVIEKWNTRKPIDNIMEQLEEEKEYSHSDFSRYINEYELSLDDECDDFFYKGLGRAIDIIRAGGKE